MNLTSNEFREILRNDQRLLEETLEAVKKRAKGATRARRGRKRAKPDPRPQGPLSTKRIER